MYLKYGETMKERCYNCKNQLFVMCEDNLHEQCKKCKTIRNYHSRSIDLEDDEMVDD